MDRGKDGKEAIVCGFQLPQYLETAQGPRAGPRLVVLTMTLEPCKGAWHHGSLVSDLLLNSLLVSIKWGSFRMNFIHIYKLF